MKVYCTGLLVGLFAASCGGSGETYRIPADSPLRPFSAPEREDLVEEELPAPATVPAPAEKPSSAPKPASPAKPK